MLRLPAAGGGSNSVQLSSAVAMAPLSLWRHCRYGAAVAMAPLSLWRHCGSNSVQLFSALCCAAGGGSNSVQLSSALPVAALILYSFLALSLWRHRRFGATVAMEWAVCATQWAGSSRRQKPGWLGANRVLQPIKCARAGLEPGGSCSSGRHRRYGATVAMAPLSLWRRCRFGATVAMAPLRL